MRPLTFQPIFKHYLWGGRNLERLGRRLPPGVTAESWEIAAHRNGESVVRDGLFAGLSLTEIHTRLGADLVGRHSAWALERGVFPLLVKLLDANRPLSVQVHPDDAYALEHEGNELGKSEMWVILHAQPGARVILGVKKGVTRPAFRQAIAEGRLEPLLHEIPVRAGDHVCVPAGSLHAIMGGLLLAEIQQNSDTTYRVYDWNRLDADGRPRPLHVERALEVINFDQVEPALSRPEIVSDTGDIRRSVLCRTPYFTVERLEFAARAAFFGRCDGDSLEIWGVLDGKAAINEVELQAVDFALLPAVMGHYTVDAPSRASLLRVYVEAPGKRSM